MSSEREGNAVICVPFYARSRRPCDHSRPRTVLFPAINVNDSVTKSKFDNNANAEKIGKNVLMLPRKLD